MDIEFLNSKMELILNTLDEIKDGQVQKIYDTKALCAYLNVGKAVVEKLRQDGELNYTKVGRTILYRQSDVDALLHNNHVNYVR